VKIVVTYLWPGGKIQIWPVPMGEAKIDAWKSARAAFELSLEQWTQMAWGGTDYVIETAESINREPIWPDKTLGELLKLGFADRIIDNDNHPYVLQLRGIDG
jgi:hypothetical protein